MGQGIEGDVIDERYSGAPQSPAPPPPPPRSETQTERAIRIASEARDLGREIAAVVGRPPIPSIGQEGTGLAGAVACLVDAATDTKKAEAKRARDARILLAVLGALATLIAIVGAVRGWYR